MIEDIKCVICGSAVPETAAQTPSMRASIIIECPSCHHVFDTNQDIHSGYNDNAERKSVIEKYTVARLNLKLHEDGTIANGTEYGAHFARRIAFCHEYIETFVNGPLVPAERRPRMLDIGCGASGSLRYFSDLGFDVFGIDTDAVALDFQQSICPEAVVEKGFFPDASFDVPMDVVIAFHVLEHIPDPIQFLSSIRNSASKPALIIFEVPNLVNSRNSEQDMRTWNMWGASGVHLQHYSKRSMSMALAKAGWSVLKFRDPLDLQREVLTGAAISGLQSETRSKVWAQVA